MPIDPTALANLQSLQKPAVAAYWKITWDPLDANQTRYYSDSMYAQLAPFIKVGVNIEARIVGSIVKEAQFEINPDLRTETISITFDDIDRAISAKFQTFKSGVQAELIFYYPNEGSTPISYSAWFGQLQAPKVYGHKTLQTVATNGFRSREQLIPKRTHPKECTANFGAWMPSTFSRETNLCPYEDGVLGLPGQTDCHRMDTTICNTKLATTDGRYFGGFLISGQGTITGQGNSYIASTRGNQSNLKTPIRVIAGQKFLKSNALLLWSREYNPGSPNNGFVSGIFEVGEGPIGATVAGGAYVTMYDIKFLDKTIEQMHIALRWGIPEQNAVGYAAGSQRFNGTAHFLARYGPVNPGNIGFGAVESSGQCRAIGFCKVAVFSDASTYGRQWTDSRVWWLMELYTNQKFGMAYPKERFTIADWITADYWSRFEVSLTARFMDGETQVYSGRRSTFEAALEGRPVAEQIEDICRSGAISVPFQHEGEFTVRTFRPATVGELSAARVFTDIGQTRNIVWGDGQPAINLEQVPDDKVVNEVILTYENGLDFDTEDIKEFHDPNQKLKAGRVLGENNLQSVPKRFSAFGVRTLQEVARLGYRLLRFGEFDEGGTQNNLKAKFTVPFEQALGLVRYEIITIVSTLLDGFEIGTDDGVNDWVQAPVYFRILKMRKLSGGVVEIAAQAYNQLAYEDFETVTDDTPGAPAAAPILSTGGGGGGGCELTFGTVTYDAATGLLTVPIEPC